MKTIFILMDSLNRHYLPAYGNPWVRTPGLDRLAARGVVFDNHYCGSAPCMPARRDLMTGRYTFLETPWGPLEPYDDVLANALREQGRTYTHMITDHYHYWEWYGLGYNCFYNTWEFVRGQEGDNERPRVKDPAIPPTRGKGADRRQHWVNRAGFEWENDLAYPTPQCFARAMDFLDHNHDADNWFLHLEVFTPHEPFEAPRRYREQYHDTWNDGYHYDWPFYDRLDPVADDPAAVAHIRKSYAASLTMADVWLGKLLDRMDRYNLWDDTAVILTTDHGHLLGEHGFWAKNYMFDYRELMHIPLIVAAPGAPAGARRRALTSAVDLNPTLRDWHGVAPTAHPHGASLRPLLERDASHHDAVLYGYFAKDIGLTDGRYTYCRQPRPDSITHHHTAMPVNAMRPKMRAPFEQAELGRFLRHTNLPVYRAAIPSYRHRDAPDRHLVYDLATDPGQAHPVDDPAREARLAGQMRDLLRRCDAPPCQFERTGLG